jgi:hypothetical protein
MPVRPTVTILDDYQGVALSMTDWSPVSEAYTLDVIGEHIADEDALTARLRDSDVIVAMR